MKNLLIQVYILLLCSTANFAQDCTIGTTVGSTCILATDGTLTIPAGVELMIEVKAWGAGGGSESAKNRRSGGGGGAYFTSTYSVIGGSSFPIVVGQGALASPGGDTTFDFDGGGMVIVGGGGLGTTTAGLGGTGTGSIPGGVGGGRETGGLEAGGGGGGSGPGSGPGGKGGDPVDGIGGTAGMAGSTGGAGGAGGNDATLGATSGTNGAFPGGGAGGKGTTATVEDGAAGGHGQVIVCVTAVLPVELLSFSSKISAGHIIIEWKTSNELNNRGFEVQKSDNSIDWDTYEFVDGKGTSFDLNKYESIDRSPFNGSNYYRLKQIDYDGNFEYSKVISLVFDKREEIISFPNPISDQFILAGHVSDEVNINIYNSTGQIVFQKIQLMDGDEVIDVSKLAVGNYFLNIFNASTGASIYKQLLVKN